MQTQPDDHRADFGREALGLRENRYQTSTLNTMNCSFKYFHLILDLCNGSLCRTTENIPLDYFLSMHKLHERQQKLWRTNTRFVYLCSWISIRKQITCILAFSCNAALWTSRETYWQLQNHGNSFCIYQLRTSIGKRFFSIKYVIILVKIQK